MILVSFSAAEDALFNDVKKNEIFSSQGTENPFSFFLNSLTAEPKIVQATVYKDKCVIPKLNTC